MYESHTFQSKTLREPAFSSISSRDIWASFERLAMDFRVLPHFPDFSCAWFHSWPASRLFQSPPNIESSETGTKCVFSPTTRILRGRFKNTGIRPTVKLGDEKSGICAGILSESIANLSEEAQSVEAGIAPKVRDGRLKESISQGQFSDCKKRPSQKDIIGDFLTRVGAFAHSTPGHIFRVQPSACAVYTAPTRSCVYYTVFNAPYAVHCAAAVRACMHILYRCLPQLSEAFVRPYIVHVLHALVVCSSTVGCARARWGVLLINAFQDHIL